MLNYIYNHREQAGITLIELLVVITLIGILLLMTTPKLLPVYEFHEIEQTLLLIEEDLRSAQQRAMGEGSRVEVRFVGDEKYQLVDAAGQIWQERFLPHEMRVTTNYDQNQLHFNERGNINRGGRVQIHYGSEGSGKMQEFVFQVGSGRFYTNP